MSPRESDDLLLEVKGVIQKHQLIHEGDCILAAVSGGVDSVVLLDVLHRLTSEIGFSLHVAHLNHQLRGSDADGDADSVAGAAADYGLACTIEEADIRKKAEEEKRSVEDAGRQARLEFLDKVRAEQGARCIALGHHRNDQAETVLMRLIRGSGSTGLGAMELAREQTWIRPLLTLSRPRIESYADDRSLKYRSDVTNHDPAHLRNRIRHQLIPYLESSYNPDIVPTLARSAELLRSEDEYLVLRSKEALQKALLHRDKRKFILAEPVVSGYHISIRRRMLRTLLGNGFPGLRRVDFQSVQSLVTLLEQGSGSVQISANVSAHLSDGLLIVYTRPHPYEVQLKVPGNTTLADLGVTVETRIRLADDVRPSLQSMGRHQACFDLDALAGQPLLLRNRREGDRFQPFGMTGSRTVSDFLIDKKVPRPLRDDVPLLVCEDIVLWVVGLRTAQQRSVADSTRQVLEASVSGSEGAWLD